MNWTSWPDLLQCAPAWIQTHFYQLTVSRETHASGSLFTDIQSFMWCPPLTVNTKVKLVVSLVVAEGLGWILILKYTLPKYTLPENALPKYTSLKCALFFRSQFFPALPSYWTTIQLVGYIGIRTPSWPKKARHLRVSGGVLDIIVRQSKRDSKSHSSTHSRGRIWSKVKR